MSATASGVFPPFLSLLPAFSPLSWKCLWESSFTSGPRSGIYSPNCHPWELGSFLFLSFGYCFLKILSFAFLSVVFWVTLFIPLLQITLPVCWFPSDQISHLRYFLELLTSIIFIAPRESHLLFHTCLLLICSALRLLLKASSSSCTPWLKLQALEWISLPHIHT